MTIHRTLPLTLIAAAVLAGCSSLPANNSLLDEARADYSNAQASPKVTSLAAGELRQAGHSLDKADAAWRKDESVRLVNHLAYVTKQEVAIARETADQKAAEQSMTTAAAERDAIRLEARTREADAAQRSAQYSQAQAEASQRQSEASLRQSEASQRQSELSQRSAERARRESDASQRQSEASERSAEQSRRESDVARMNAEAAQRQAGAERQAANVALLNAQDARQQTEAAQRRSRELEAQLVAMEAKKTDRGMVVTLGDVLFDTDEAQLKAGGVRNVQKLADFFKENPQRNVMIEGFTDSVGTGDHNQRLSDRRADSVRTALLGMGMSSDRIKWRGYGESYPVAGNDTAAGRQLNRRVEIVVSEDDGKISPR